VNEEEAMAHWGLLRPPSPKKLFSHSPFRASQLNYYNSNQQTQTLLLKLQKNIIKRRPHVFKIM
jgi:hypothetical protein